MIDNESVEQPKKPLVSVITACYNAAPYLKSTYESICSQTISDWEWIVTDDGSTDESNAILKKLAAIDGRIVVISLSENSGAAVARNRSLRAASGQFIAFLDADDTWDASKLALQVGYMRSCFAPLTATAYRVKGGGNGHVESVIDKHRSVKAFSYRDLLLKRLSMGCSTVIYDASIYPK